MGPFLRELLFWVDGELVRIDGLLVFVFLDSIQDIRLGVSFGRVLSLIGGIRYGRGWSILLLLPLPSFDLLLRGLQYYLHIPIPLHFIVNILECEVIEIIQPI